MKTAYVVGGVVAAVVVIVVIVVPCVLLIPGKTVAVANKTCLIKVVLCLKPQNWAKVSRFAH